MVTSLLPWPLTESPAIIFAILMANLYRTPEERQEHQGFLVVMRESFTEGAQILLVGTMVIGMITGATGKTIMDPFIGMIFKGMLAVFLLDMGEPIKIYDLAKKMIQLSGLKLRDENNIKGDIDILITGLRPGEKLYEELLIENNSISTDHPKIFKAQDNFIPWPELSSQIRKLEEVVAKNDQRKIIEILKKLVNGYRPSKDIVDYIFNEKLKKNPNLSK